MRKHKQNKRTNTITETITAKIGQMDAQMILHNIATLRLASPENPQIRFFGMMMLDQIGGLDPAERGLIQDSDIDSLKELVGNRDELPLEIDLWPLGGI